MGAAGGAVATVAPIASGVLTCRLTESTVRKPAEGGRQR